MAQTSWPERHSAQQACGAVAAGDPAVGGMVRTRDAGMQPVRWIGGRMLSAAELARWPNLRPIRIRAGALGGVAHVHFLFDDHQLVLSNGARLLASARRGRKLAMRHVQNGKPLVH